MSPATLGYPFKDIKLLFVNDKENNCTYWLKPALYSGQVKLADLVRKFRPGCKIPDDPIYWQVYRRIRRLAELGYVRIEKKERIDWKATIQMREDDVRESVQNIFLAEIRKDTPPIISSETLSAEPDKQISTVKKVDPAFYVVPTANLFTLLSRVQNSNRFLEPAKSRQEWGNLKADIGINCAKLKSQRKRCPYYLPSRTREARIDAVFRLRSMRKHSYFRRRDKKVVNPEVVRELRYVQGKFDRYVNDIEGLKCALVNKEDGSIKLLDYQTRFTDETRKDGVIARFYRTIEKAGESFNTAVFLTLTSFPPSEATKHQHRESLWHVNRHFAVAWNAYLSLLQKRRRAARRDELLNLKRVEVEKTRAVMKGPDGMIILTRAERIAALQPMKIDFHIGETVKQIRKTEPDRLILTDEEYQECKDRVEFRPKYLQVYEFQKNGMIHGHCVIFGSSWLDKFNQIKQDWVRLGQGERIHIYALHKDGKVWKWSKESPRDARNRQPVDYLMKYLGKGVRLSSSHGMYWAINKRFFTNSRALLSDTDLPIEMEDLPESQYNYLGTFKGDEIPPWLVPKEPTFYGSRGIFDALGWGGDTGPGVPA
jgi:hypothetical protein